MKKIMFTLLFFGCINFLYANLSMQLDTTKISVGQSFRLILSKDEAFRGMPDLSPLHQDFTIIGTEQSTQYSIINGQSQAKSQWIIELLPKKAGTLTIPALQVGQEKTSAQQIEVGKEQAADSQPLTDEQKEIMLIAKADEPQPYVNQQVIYTVKLYNSRQLINADYQSPQVDDALLMPLGKSRQYQTTENGRMYTVEEQKYAIFAQKSKAITIIPPIFKATTFDAIPHQVIARAKSLTLQVKPALASDKNQHWLPAKQVELIEKYDGEVTNLTQGSTLIRTITLTARGVPAQLLPPLQFASSDQLKVYADKPTEKNSIHQQNILGTTTTKVTYLFNKAGKVIIPSIEIPWYNSQTNQTEKAVLPALTLTIKESTETVQPPVDNQTINNQIPQLKAAASQAQPTITAPQINFHLPWLIAIFFAVIWLITLGFLLHRRASKKDNSKSLLSNLQQACMANQPEAARDALLDWARLQWPNKHILNLADLLKLIDSETFKQQIHLLSAALYQPNQQIWHGAELWHWVNNFKKNDKIKQQKQAIIPPLNPS